MDDPFVTNRLAVACVELCNISYDDPASICNGVATIPSIDPGGRWQCVWGPAYDDSNLVFAAACGSSAGQPAQVAVVTRGTDANVDHCGLIKQVIEDWDVVSHRKLPWAPESDSRIAQGTLDAFDVVTKLRHPNGKQTLLEFLTKFLGAHPSAQLIVTGHSLGGCWSTVLAAWLSFALPSAATQIVPVTFAAPTAGNPEFANRFSSSFPSALRYVNTMDVVPYAWQHLDTMTEVYDNHGLFAPDSVTLPIEIAERYLRWEG